MPWPRTWISAEEWHKRIITFDASWFTLTMGTGILIQSMHVFPWSTSWMRGLGYAFWVLTIILFTFFLVMSMLRLVMYPNVAFRVLDDFQQTSLLGAIPVSLDTITAGLIIHYSTSVTAIYVSRILFWTGVSLTLLVSFFGIFIMYRRQGKHQLDEVTGVWLLTFIPLIVTAALGSTLAPHLSDRNATTIVTVSFFMLAVGLQVCFMVSGIYLWRLMAHSLPANAAVISCFVLVGPFGMGAFAILGLAIDLANVVSRLGFSFEREANPIGMPDGPTIAQMIVWIGVICCLALLGLASFFLVQAFASVVVKLPRTFVIGFWSFVFPCGVYSNAFCQLSTTLRNDPMRGWAATCVVGTVLLWLMCVVMTLYKGVWRGELFIASGLQGFVEQEQLDVLQLSLQDLRVE